MLDRLKSLPLTLGLTLLIWLYAENQVRTAPETATQLVKDMHVLVAAESILLERYNVLVNPDKVDLTLAGPREELDLLSPQSIKVYLEIDPAERPTARENIKPLRISTPAGITVVRTPEVRYRLAEKAAATRPAQ